jgi:carbamoyl-phosphate synthase small subunit
MNIDQLVVPDSLSLNLSRKYFDLEVRFISWFQY